MTQRTGDLHQQAVAAENDNKHLRAVQLAGEILRLTSANYAAERLLARNLGKLGQDKESSTIYGHLCSELITKGFVVTAIETCNEAIRLCPGEFDLINTLNDIFDVIDQEEVVTRALVAPPPMDKDADSIKGTSVLEFTDEEQIIASAIALATSGQSKSSQAIAKKGVPFFSGLSRECFVSLVSEIETRHYAAGEDVFTQGSDAHAMYIILSGSVEIFRDDEKLATLKAGSIFGEMALVTAQARNATARAKYDATVFEITAEDIEKVASDHPAISSEIARFTRKRILLNVMNLSPFFQPLQPVKRREALALFETKLVQEESKLVVEGEPSDQLFVIASGECSVTKNDESEVGNELARLSCGDVFGEISLMKNVAATATVAAQPGSVILSLKREQFKELIQEFPDIERTLDQLTEQRLEEIDELMMLEAVEIEDDDFIML